MKKIYTTNCYPLTRHTLLCRMAQHTSSIRQSGDGNVSERVVTAVADARDVDSLELPPLFDVINPDALDQLFDHGLSDGTNGPGRVVFMFAGCEVEVHSDGEVTVTAPNKRARGSSATDSGGAQNEAETTLD